ncbi:MAG: hypothetical protein OEZ38_02745 [Gammaproteobacteria bacterium]|nr:hypothetical protein [Gammaproteobacteria bacterium]
MPCNKILSIVELGGYPDFTDMYKSKGFQVDTVSSMRKAIKNIKKEKPDIIVAEFNFQSDFRDRTSSLESLMAAVQGLPGIYVIVFYEVDQGHQLERLLAIFEVYAIIPFPIDEHKLERTIDRIIVENQQC